MMGMEAQSQVRHGAERSKGFLRSRDRQHVTCVHKNKWEAVNTGVKLSESTARSSSGRKLGMQYTILARAATRLLAQAAPPTNSPTA